MRARCLDRLDMGVVREHDPRSRIAQDVGDLRPAQPVVDGGADQARLAQPVRDLEAAGRVEPHACDAILDLTAEPDKDVGGAVGAEIQRLEVRRPVAFDDGRLGGFGRRVHGEDVDEGHVLRLVVS